MGWKYDNETRERVFRLFLERRQEVPPACHLYTCTGVRYYLFHE